MRSKAIIVLVVAILAGGAGYWVGCYRTYQWWEAYWAKDTEAQWRRNGEHQASICLTALTNLHAGRQSEAEAVLENYLSEGVARHISSWTNPPRDQFSLKEIMLIRAVRDYRLQHPWTNDDPERVERLQKAFKLAK